ncbi:7053_t:CDS:2, partial [Scutellospora calospora]
MDHSIVESGCDFDTFEEVRATIERYAMQTNIVIILGRMTKNPNNNSYIQVLFVCEKQGKYGEKNDEYTTKCTGYPFAIGINYRKHTKKFVITKSHLEHNYNICLDTTKFSTVVRKLDKDDLGLVEKLYDNRLRTKDIFSVLNSVSSRYIHKPDAYNAVSRQRKRKLQGLSEIELLFKTLRDDKSIVGNIALKDAYNNERDQNGEFIQAIFWAYHNSILEFSVGKDVLIIDATYKTNSIDRFGSTYPLAFALVYSETQEFYTYMYATWMPHKESWLAPYTKSNINLDIRSSQRVESLHSKLKGVENRITPIDKVFSVLWKQMTPYRHIIAIYLFHLHTYVPPNEVYQRWNVHNHAEIEHATSSHITQIFEQLLIYHYSAFSNLIQQASEYIIEHGEIPKLSQKNQTKTKAIFETISIKNTANCEKIQMPVIKCSCSQPPNNNHIRSADEDKENKMSLNKTVIKHTLYTSSQISQDMILQVHNPIGDSHCGFRSLAVAILKDEKRWQEIKITMRDYLVEREEMYGNILGYNFKQLMDILSYIKPECSQDYWFYTPE